MPAIAMRVPAYPKLVSLARGHCSLRPAVAKTGTKQRVSLHKQALHEVKQRLSQPQFSQPQFAFQLATGGEPRQRSLLLARSRKSDEEAMPVPA
jgi:hypothetical protein